uniref:Cyclic nucleotide-binding domain-containing protein n=1 Tax=Macrostomum lignano TaxID=282301 RepID=A0A1I8HUV7_9PLAT
WLSRLGLGRVLPKSIIHTEARPAAVIGSGHAAGLNTVNKVRQHSQNVFPTAQSFEIVKRRRSNGAVRVASLQPVDAEGQGGGGGQALPPQHSSLVTAPAALCSGVVASGSVSTMRLYMSGRGFASRLAIASSSSSPSAIREPGTRPGGPASLRTPRRTAVAVIRRTPTNAVECGRKVAQARVAGQRLQAVSLRLTESLHHPAWPAAALKIASMTGQLRPSFFGCHGGHALEFAHTLLLTVFSVRQSDLEVMLDILRHCEYRKCQRDDVIIWQGERGEESDKSGEVAPMTGVDDEESARQVLGTAPEAPAPLPKALSGADKMRQLLMQLDQEAKDKQRQLQPEAKEEEVAMFDRKSQQEKEYAERHGFIDSSHLFNWWNPRFKRLLEMSLRKERFAYDSVIVRQGQAFSALHFIIRGVVSVSVDSSQHRRQYPVQFATWKPASELEALLARRKPRVNCEQKSLQQEAIRVRRELGYSEAERLATGRNRHLAFVEEGDCIVRARTAHAQLLHRAMGEVETLILDLQNIERLITRRHQRTLNLLKLLVLEKVHQRLHQLGRQAVTPSEPASTDDVTLFAMSADRLQSELARRPPTASEMAARRQSATTRLTQRDREMATLSKLFLLDKAALIRPCVPGSVGVRLASHQQSRYWSRRLREKEERDREAQEDRVARREFHVQARSLRQLTNSKRDSEPEDELKLHKELQKTSARSQGNIVNEILETTTVQNASGEKISLMVMLKMMQRLKEVRRRLSLKSSGGERQRQSQQRPSSSGSAASATFDEETSDAVLVGLEDRIGDFLRRCSIHREESQSTAPATTEGVTKLRRYDLDPEKVPLPGGTVLVKRKPCTAGTVSSEHGHQHTRRYMLPNNALRILQAHSAVRMQRDSALQQQPPEQEKRLSVSAGTSRGRQHRPSLRGNRLL